MAAEHAPLGWRHPEVLLEHPVVALAARALNQKVPKRIAAAQLALEPPTGRQIRGILGRIPVGVSVPSEVQANAGDTIVIADGNRHVAIDRNGTFEVGYVIRGNSAVLVARQEIEADCGGGFLKRFVVEAPIGRGEEVLTFRPLRAGRATITFALRRPWEKGSRESRTIDLVVEP